MKPEKEIFIKLIREIGRYLKFCQIVARRSIVNLFWRRYLGTQVFKEAFNETGKGNHYKPQLCAKPRHFCKLDVATSIRMAFLDFNLHGLQLATSNSSNWGCSVIQNYTSDTPYIVLLSRTFLFVFWKNFRIPKRHFKMYWPLNEKKCLKERKIPQVNKICCTIIKQVRIFSKAKEK